jgi:hypothetical protein
VVVDKELAIEVLTDPVVGRLMTIPGVDAIAGIAIVAVVGDFHRFDDPDRLAAYVGLNPKVRQSGNSAPVHGRISKAGRGQVRGLLVEAAWSASRAPGPLRAVLSTDPGASRFPDRGRRDLPQAHRARLASDHQRSGLRLRPTQSGHSQAPQARAGCRCAIPPR